MTLPNAVPKMVRRHILGVVSAFCVSGVCASGVLALDLDVVVQSSGDAIDGDIRAATLLSGFSDDATPVRADVIAAAKADYSRVLGVLYNLGYFAPDVSIRLDGREAADLSTFAGRGRISRATIRVDTGRSFQFGQTSIGPLAPGTTMPEGFRTGAPASLDVMQGAVQASVSDWRDAGHAKADVGRQTIVARHPAGALDVAIAISPGPHLRFGQLRVTGDTTLTSERVRQIAGLPTGVVFNPDDVDRTTTRLRRTGVFSSVAAVEAEAVNADGTLDIEVQLQDATPRRFGFGAEISTEEGLELSSFWLHRNLRGGGERLRFDARVSGIGGDTGGEDFELGVRYSIPGMPTYRTDVFVDAEIASLNEPNLSVDRFSLEAGLVHTSSDQRQYTYALGFRAGDTEDAFGRRSYRIVTLPLSHTRDYRNNSLNATSGYFAKFELTPFLSVSGTEDGARLFVDGRVFHSVGADDRVTFALRGQLGSLFGPSLATAPADYLFFSGGGGTVRGQDFQSLGVTQASGLVSGGRAFLQGSAELRVKTSDKLSIVGFFDIGYVGEEQFPDGTSGLWHSGAGAGIRYDTGVGPIRVDVAVPVEGTSSSDNFEIYIGIGQAF